MFVWNTANLEFGNRTRLKSHRSEEGLLGICATALPAIWLFCNGLGKGDLATDLSPIPKVLISLSNTQTHRSDRKI